MNYDISDINLSKIERKFIELSKKNLDFKRSEVTKKYAIDFFKKRVTIIN